MNNSRDVWQRLWSYIQPDQRYLWGALLAAQGAALIDLAVAWVLKPFLNATADAASHPVAAGEATLVRVSLSLVLLFAVRAAFNLSLIHI